MGGRKTVGVILKEAFRDYRANFRFIFITVLLVYGATYLYDMLVPLLLGAVGLDRDGMLAFFGVNRYAEPTDPNYNPSLTAIVSIFSSFITAIFGLVSSMFALNAYSAVLRLKTGKKLSIKHTACDFASGWMRYLGIVAWSKLWEAIWSLALIIPGIVKQYAYMLAPYLVIQYPRMPVREALKLSASITKGYKGRLFGLSLCYTLPFVALSFCLSIAVKNAYPGDIMNIIINCIILILSILLLEPVTYLVNSIAYLDIKHAAIENGLLRASEYVVVPPDDEPLELPGTITEQLTEPAQELVAGREGE